MGQKHECLKSSEKRTVCESEFWMVLSRNYISLPIYKRLNHIFSTCKLYKAREMSVAQIFFGSCTPVAAPLMPVAIVSQFKRGKSTNQIKNRTQLANKSDCCAACQMNETAQRSRSCEITRRISNSSHRIVSCYRTCSTTSKIQRSEAAMYENYFMP